MATILLIIALIIAVVAVIFALQNTAQVTIAFFIWQFDQSLALVLLLALASGVIIGLLTILPSVIKSKMQLNSMKKKNTETEKNALKYKDKAEYAEKKISEMTQKETNKETAAK